MLALRCGECQHVSTHATRPPEISKRSISMNFTPLHDRVLVRRIEGDEKTSGGLIIPDTAKEKPQEGEIISVGAGAKDDAGARIAMDVKAGDRILFGKWSGTEIKIDGEELMIMKESDILGIMA
jgi:chaperonin GroES